jgi:peroxiredoxin
MKKIFLLKILALLFGFQCFILKAQSSNESYLAKVALLKEMEGKPAPFFEATTVSGKKVSNQSLKGKTVVLNFWFVGCVPCQEEMPLLNRLTQTYQDKDDIIFLSFSRSSKSETKKFLSKNEFKYEVVTDAKPIAQTFNVSGYPSNFIIDKEGIVRYVGIGSSDDIGNMLNQEIQGVLKSPNAVHSKSRNAKPAMIGTQVFKNEKDEVITTQEAMQMIGAKTHMAFRKVDKEGKEYYQLKKAGSN